MIEITRINNEDFDYRFKETLSPTKEETKSICEDKKILSLDDIEKMRYKKENKVKNKNVSHYDLWNGFEAIDVMKQVLSKDEYIGYLKGNILKYQLRLSKKDSIEKEVIKIRDYTYELNNILEV